MYHKLAITVLFCIIIDTLSAQRVFISESVSSFDARIYEETDENARVNWEVYLTDNLNPIIPGNWRTTTQDSAVFTFRKSDVREGSYTYRIIDDSTSTKFRFDGKTSDFFEVINYMIVESDKEADFSICVTPNKWIADNVVYVNDEELNYNRAHWRFVTQEEFGTVKVYITTNREKADVLVYFTDNPLEAQIR